jgi:phage shock protein A
MNIFDRIAMLFRANVNAAISEFEQPEKMLNQIILDMRSQLVKAKQQVAAAIADEKRLQDQTRQELKEAEDWERRAMLAVQQNQDDLAKQALMRRSEHISRGDQLNLTWQAHKQETDRLKDSLRTLNDNIEEANRKKNLLLAKQRRADAQKRINETMSHISEKSAFEAFARMEEKIEANERKVRASAEIEEEFSGDKLANDFKRLEAAGGNQSADILLIQLKQKMGVLPGGTTNNKALGAGAQQQQQQEEDAVDVEIHDENK